VNLPALVQPRGRRRGASWRSLATQHVHDGRKLLGALLEGPIVFTPFEEDGARGYRFRGSAVLTGLVEGVVEVVRLSSPKYGEMWRPHREPRLITSLRFAGFGAPTVGRLRICRRPIPPLRDKALGTVSKSKKRGWKG
jgi:hypothetical protein